MAKSFVKALYDYNSSEIGDLNFRVGDIIQVIDKVDDNWVKGELHGNVGLFPASFAEPTMVVENAIQKTVIAKETFIGGKDGELIYFRGDELTFFAFVDSYWCHGSCRGEVGLFPVHTVDGLDEVLPHSDSLLLSKSESITSPEDQDRQVPAEDDIFLEEPHVKTLYPFKGLSNFELTFPAGKMVLLTHDIDEEWFEGTYQGNTGIFPKSFVEVVVPLPKEDVENVEDNYVDIPYAIAVYPFVGETESELSFREGDVVILLRWISAEWIEGECNGQTGMFPSSFVQIEKELPESFEMSMLDATLHAGDDDQESSSKEVVNSVFKVGDWAVAIYSFSTDIEGDLSFEVGDPVFIEKVIDEEWVFGRKNDDEVGLCPAVFLELHAEQEGSATHNDSHDKVVLNETKFVTKEDSYSANLVGEKTVPNKQTSGIREEMDSIYEKNSVFLKSNGTLLNSFSCSARTGLPPISSSKIMPSNIELTPAVTSSIFDPKPLVSSDAPATSDGSTTNESSTSLQSNTEDGSIRPTSLSLGQKPLFARKPPISPKPDFLKKPALAPKPDALVGRSHTLPRSFNLVKTASTSQDLNSDTIASTSEHENVPREKEFKAGVLPHPCSGDKTLVNPKIPSQKRVHPQTNGWVKFDDREDSLSLPLAQGNKKFSPKVTPRKKHSEETRISYRTLLDKSLKDEMSLLQPEEASQRPVPPPRVDLMTRRSSAPETLKKKLLREAEEFEKSHSKGGSLSLNELRTLSQNSSRPVAAKRRKEPLVNRSVDEREEEERISAEGFPILDDLEEQLTKLNSEIQKENQVLSGVEVLINTVDKESSRREELESKKGITERKLYDLRRLLKTTEERKKRLVKLLAAYSCEEELRLKLQQLQETVKENEETKTSLESLLNDCEDDETRSEIEENITFCDEAIKNSKSELDALLEIISEIEGKDPKQSPKRNVVLRKKVIDEVLNTEKSFACDLHLCLKYFLRQLKEWKVDTIDFELVFGNMEEVAELSSRLLQRLETATNHVDLNDQIIGSCFVDFSEEITVVYGRYCRNHDEAIAFLEKSAEDEEIQRYFNKCLESIREFSNCWDLSSFLIKPVQRILKYPLLLNELLKNTPDDHPDKHGLIKAIDVMTTAANNVNEFKRRKELVQKYQKVEESGLSTKFQKFTWHSVVKKSSRFNQKITQFTGFGSQTVDQKFHENEKLFYQIEKSAKNLIKNIAQYLEQFEDVHASQIQTADNIIDFCQENSVANAVREYHGAQKHIGEDLLNDLKRRVDDEVVSPLISLVNIFQGPHRLIQKRHDKCLDYDSWSNKVEKIKDREKWKQAKDELEFAKKNYEALNAQLLDELPSFNAKALTFLEACVANFATSHKTFFAQALNQFSPSVQVSVVNPTSYDIISDFFSQSQLATHEVFQLSFNPKKSLSVNKPVRPNVSPKTARSSLSVDKKTVRSRSLTRRKSESKGKAPLPPSEPGGLHRNRTVSATDGNLVKKSVGINMEVVQPTPRKPNDNSENSRYIVKHTFNAEAPTQLSVNKDDIVTVVEFHDAFGHSDWWRVKHNGKVGFVPSSYVAPYTMPMVSTSTSGLTRNGSAVVDDYVVMYDFEAEGPNEVDVASGDVVRVREKSDVSGSKEWWLVETRGKRGYVPASYLASKDVVDKT